MIINSSIFKEYDIRGVYPEEINADAVYHIAAGFVEFLNAGKVFGPILVGRDARLSSPVLHDACIQGMLDQGRDVYDIDLASTPLFYFSVVESGVAGGAMITASHNPKEYNGIKFVKEGAMAIDKESGLSAIEAFASQIMPRRLSQGKRFPKDFSQQYVDFLLSKSDIKRSVKFLLDLSNGSTGSIVQKLLIGLNVETRPLFFDPDGNFPNHPPDPLDKKSIEIAGRAVVDNACEFGVIIDGDGDRIVFLDENGRQIQSDVVGAFLADHLVHSGDLAVMTKHVTRSFVDIVRKKGGDIVFSRVGHTHMKRTMKENQAVFGIEPSGHMYFKEFNYMDSSLLALVHLLSFFSQTAGGFKNIIAPYQTYFHSGIISFRVENANRAIEALKDFYKDGVQEMFDGLNVSYPDWWFTIRPSNTEPLLRLTIEARTKELLGEKQKELEEKINQ